MQQYTDTYTIRLSKTQKQTLKKLKTKYKINPQKFIRDAIREKLENEFKKDIIIEKVKIPF